MLYRFLDGYEHAGKAPVANAIGSFINNIGTASSLTQQNFVEDVIGGSQSYLGGFFVGGNILAGSAVATGIEAGLLGGFALNGANEVGKIIAGVGNMANDAY